MAYINCHYFSFTLKHNVEINVIVPTPEGDEQITDDKTKSVYPYETGLPVLYLLHGAYGDASSWTRFSCIERYAQKNRCVVVMASAENSFYQNMFRGGAYYTFFTEELPAYITSIFPVSKKREDTYIAGLSMGGYGAWFLGLSRPDLYSKAASMSGALDITDTVERVDGAPSNSPFHWENIFEHPHCLKDGPADLIWLYKQCREAGNAPKLYQACGTEDFLYSMNLSVKEQMEQLNADLVYEEGPGGHTWDFWDQYIQRIFQWIFPA